MLECSAIVDDSIVQIVQDRINKFRSILKLYKEKGSLSKSIIYALALFWRYTMVLKIKKVTA